MADEASKTGTGRACLRRAAGGRSPVVLRHRGDGLTVGPRRRVADRVHSLRGVIIGLALAVIAWVAAAVVLFAGTPMPNAADPSPCPARKSLVASDGDKTLRVRADAPAGSTTLIHLCVDEGTEAVRRWSVTATTNTGRSVPLAVQPLGDRLAIALAPPATDGATLSVQADLMLGAATFEVPLSLR
ncbi:hypothetical protein AB0J83_34800 [Actinoplanes sp. NPDC049596]|uniref:hypothetical protein n=1 Tax=unclassified Actinoplanes TaxID=2626549 RepID=UPI003429EFDA